MPFPYSNPLYSDRAHTIAQAISLPILDSPIPATTAQYVLTQEFMVHISNFAPLPLNLPHPDPHYKDFLLVDEGTLTDMLGGMVKWQRTYAKTPDSWEQFTTYSYNFIGFVQGGDAAIPGSPGRNRFPLTVACRIKYDYFLISPDGSSPNPIDGRLYTSPAQISQVQPLIYYLANDQIPTQNPTPWLVDTIADKPPLNQTVSPSIALYKTWMNNARTYGFQGDTVVNGDDPMGLNPNTKPVGLINPSNFAPEPSTLDRWMGNIWVRATKSILAR